MAGNLDDGEFWLPSMFLTEKDTVMEDTQLHGTGFKVNRADSMSGYGFDTNGFSSALFPSEFAYDGGGFSDLGSPVESLVSSNETESDEEEHIVELTRRMAYSLDVSSDNTAFVIGYEKSKGRCLSSSPQSTLSRFGSECGCSHGSPTSTCQGPSPRATWDLLLAAAGEVERMRLKGEAYCAHTSRGLQCLPRTPSPVTVPVKHNTIDLGLFPLQSLSHQQLQVAKFQILKQQQMLREQDSFWGGQNKLTGTRQQQQRQRNPMIPNRGGRANEMIGGRNSRSVGLSSSAWPSLHQAQQQNRHHNGLEMRALFLGNSGKKECAGTGVFLPRQVNNPTETRRPACSTVLVPAKVMQALNLKLDDMVSAEPQYGSRSHFHSGLDTDFAVKLKLRSNHSPPSQNRKNMRAQQRPSNHEIKLPQEWTY